MSIESLKDYDPTIAARAQELALYLGTAATSGSVDLSKAIGFFTSDFMVDMAYVTLRVYSCVCSN